MELKDILTIAIALVALGLSAASWRMARARDSARLVFDWDCEQMTWYLENQGPAWAYSVGLGWLGALEMDAPRNIGRLEPGKRVSGDLSRLTTEVWAQIEWREANGRLHRRRCRVSPTRYAGNALPLMVREVWLGPGRTKRQVLRSVYWKAVLQRKPWRKLR